MPVEVKRGVGRANLLTQIAEFNLDYAYLGLRIKVNSRQGVSGALLIDSLTLYRGSEVYGCIDKYGNSFAYLSKEVSRWSRMAINLACGDSVDWSDVYE